MTIKNVNIAPNQNTAPSRNPTGPARTDGTKPSDAALRASIASETLASSVGGVPLALGGILPQDPTDALGAQVHAGLIPQRFGFDGVITSSMVEGEPSEYPGFSNLPEDSRKSLVGRGAESARDVARETAQNQLGGALNTATMLGASFLQTADGKKALETVGQQLTTQFKQEAGETEEAGFKLNGEGGDTFGVKDALSKLGAQANTNIDFSKMPIEDAVALMFFLLSKSAKEDVKDILNDMQAVTNKKKAMREALSAVKEDRAKLEADAGKKYDELLAAGAIPAGVKREDFIKAQNFQMGTVKINGADGTATYTAGSLVMPLTIPAGTPPPTPPPADPDAEDVGGAGDASGSGSGPGGVDSAMTTQSSNEVSETGEAQGAADPSQIETIGGGTGTLDQWDNFESKMKDDMDSLSEMSEEKQLKMQMAMDRMTKADTANSNLMKKLADTVNSIISNMK